MSVTSPLSPNIKPHEYRPPTTPGDLLRRYENGERYFERTVLTSVEVNDAVLSGVNLNNSTISSSNFARVDLSGSTLTNVFCSESKFSECNLTRCDLSCAELEFTKLIDNICDHMNLRRSKLPRSYVKWHRLHYADLRDCDLSGATFEGCSFKHADLHGAFLYNTAFRGADFRSSASKTGYSHLHIYKGARDKYPTRDIKVDGIDGLTTSDEAVRARNAIQDVSLRNQIIESRVVILEALASLRDVWGEDSGKNLDLTGSTLRNLDLRGLLFRRVTLEDCTLEDVNLSHGCNAPRRSDRSRLDCP